ncbi:AraC family transcriptional regulator ['Paenibacillus yunnanensis' Narsing Rao et al. 2020]|uniref:AraC family transcriptional regulator n=1 Tax=Paenibacillus tengchongensis TaxID=2608684 RepID=UPI00124C1C4F|nr:AraC family transcriptional regulator [Paenibacillus tengchongensis]
MDHYLLETIKRTTDYIEDHLLAEDLCLDQIARQVNVSKFHLLRIWKGATATGIMEYVRRRRIAESLGDLLKPVSGIAWIADKYGFGSERSYNRVFKEEFGCTPGRWRKTPSPLNILDRFNADFMSTAGEGLVFFRSVRILPAFSLAGPEYRIDAGDNQLNGTAVKCGVDFFFNQRLDIIGPVRKNVYYGFTSVPEPEDGYSFYQPSLQIDQTSIIPSYMKQRQVQPHKYGVFTYIGTHRPEELSPQALESIWNVVFNRWMPTVRMELREKFSFEYLDYSKCSRQYCECDFYYPITWL